MKMNSKILALLVTSLFSLTACSTTKDCTGDCSNKMVPDSVQPDKKTAIDLKSDVSKPLALATKGALVITKNETVRAPAGDILSRDNYQDIFCHKFDQIEWQSVASLITKEMEPSGYSVEDFFKAPACQPGGYSDVVKSPILQVIADDPSKRVKFLDIIWLYYSKKRNDPAKFAEVVNAKNTKGETLLDYLETMKIRGEYPSEGSQTSVVKIIEVACSHGAVFSVYKDKKKCP
ncbi:MAG: hypothetical protein H7336_16450 [Bacteriovorax sp.]|nr:hypothetical protein [Bacteriovorax sp.]